MQTLIGDAETPPISVDKIHYAHSGSMGSACYLTITNHNASKANGATLTLKVALLGTWIRRDLSIQKYRVGDRYSFCCPNWVAPPPQELGYPL